MIWLVNMLIILLLTFWYAMIQYRKGELKWIFFVYMFFKTNYIWILLRYVTFHILVEIGICIMSPTLESFNRPFMRLWFYAALIEHAEFSLKLHNKVIVQTFRCVVALWKSWVCRYSIRFQVIKLKLLCETLRNEKWKILAWYPNKMRRYRQQNPKCGDWRWTNFQMQVALSLEQTKFLLLKQKNIFRISKPKLYLESFSLTFIMKKTKWSQFSVVKDRNNVSRNTYVIHGGTKASFSEKLACFINFY